jgi:cathepsin C
MWKTFAAAAVTFASLAKGDIPVHCLRHEIVGNWEFTVGPPGPSRSSCGHHKPDVEEKQPARSVVDLQGKATKIPVILSEPNLADVQGQQGKWTMVYDEGFEVSVGNRVFFAFSNFTFESDDGLTSSKHNVSHCGETMVGWYSNKDRTEYGCYYGSKRATSSALAVKSVRAAQRLRTSPGTTYDKPLNHMAQKAKVDALNKKLAMVQVSWKARVMPQWNGKSMRQINSYAGLQRRADSRTLAQDMMAQRHEAPSAKRKQSFLQRRATDSPHAAPAPRSGPVPDTWTWADVNGIDYTEPVMDQGDCGSCYDASTMRMLTARHKITLNNTEAIPWSINFPLFCSEYNQGCKGGYGFLTTKWSQDVGLIPATCMRYNTQGSCKLECDLDKELKGQKRYRAANHRYINSWYGNFNSSSEEAIKEEIYRNGPVVLSFEPDEDFMFYSDGIYRSAKKNSTLKKHIDYDQEWERVDHAVVAVGYGDEAGQKYWLIQNSWGPDWGEDGYFRMARGTDESGIESIPEAADVVEDEQHGRQVEALLAEHAA